MKVAVIGAHGFIGQAVCGQLSAAGVEVVSISTKGRGFDATSGLLADQLPVETELRAVLYLAQSPWYRQVPQHAAHVWSVNVLSAIKAAEWARRCGAARFVYTSTGNVYRPGFRPYTEDDPVRRDAWYPLSKVHAEEVLGLYRTTPTVTCARLFGVYGPQQTGRLIPNLIAAVAAGDPVHLQPHPTDAGDTDGFRLSLTHVEDAATVLCYLALHDGPAIVNVASPEARSIREIATAIGSSLGVSPIFARDAAPREGDLVANTDRLRSIWDGRLRSLEEGLATMLSVGEREATRHSAE